MSRLTPSYLLSELDLGMSFGNFMYFQDVYSHSRIQLIFVAIKVSCHCGIVSVFDVKNVILESINDSVFSSKGYSARRAIGE